MAHIGQKRGFGLAGRFSVFLGLLQLFLGRHPGGDVVVDGLDELWPQSPGTDFKGKILAVLAAQSTFQAKRFAPHEAVQAYRSPLQVVRVHQIGQTLAEKFPGSETQQTAQVRVHIADTKPFVKNKNPFRSFFI
ncbi:MAG: hypothetical protein PHX58_02425 [Desulfovibrio sp.]|nr:hypothetical protein [Desulfovibrio sp.]